jgi:hypothetical protein
MKKSFIAMLMLVAMVSIAFAADAPAKTEPAKTEAAVEVTGMIKAVDALKMGVTIVLADKKEAHYTLAKETKLMVDGKEAKITDLKADQPVTLKVEGKKVISVDAKVATPAEKAAEKAAPAEKPVEKPMEKPATK